MDTDTSAPSSEGSLPNPTARSPRRWWERHDPGLRATKRSARAALLVPAVFAIAQYGVGNAQTSLFAVFGAVALLLFVDFAGPPSARMRAYLGLWVASAVLITVATLCSTHGALSVAAMAVVGFVVLFAGIVSPRAVTGSTAILLTFVLPVAEPATASAIPDRLLGWALAGAICIPAALVVWTERWHDRLRARLADAADAMADLLDALSAGAATDEPGQRMDVALQDLRAQYEATPYRPTGAGPTDVALTNLVSQLEWVGARVGDIRATATPTGLEAAVAGVEAEAAGLLRQVAALLLARATDPATDGPTTLTLCADRLGAARGMVTDVVLADLMGGTGPPEPPGADAGAPPAGWSTRDVDPTYPVRMVAFAVEQMTDVALAALGIRPTRRLTAGAMVRDGAVVCPGGGRAPHLPVGLVPQQPPGSGGPGHRRGRGRGHHGGARLLGGAGHTVGPAVERAGHRVDGGAGRGRYGLGVRPRIGGPGGAPHP